MIASKKRRIPKITISPPWRSGKLSLESPDSWTGYFPERIGTVPPVPESEAPTVRELLRNLINTRPLASQNLVDKCIVVMVDDHTRPTPAARFFESCFRQFGTSRCRSQKSCPSHRMRHPHAHERAGNDLKSRG